MVRIALFALASALIATTLTLTPLLASAAAIDSASGDDLVARYSSGGYGVYNCGTCQATATSGDGRSTGDYLECIRETATLVTTEFIAGKGRQTSYQLSGVKGARGHAPHGKSTFTKGLSFTNIKFSPEGTSIYFKKKHIECSNGMTASLQCGQCLRAH